MKSKTVAVALATVLASLSMSAIAQEKGDWILRVGVGNVDPKSGNGDIVSVDAGTALAFNGTYMLSDKLGLEVLASTPFSHDIKLAGSGAKVAETKHLPPTVSLNYHFDSANAFNPYVGAGINYTLFFDEETTGPLAGSDVSLDGSFGLAAQAGFDYDISATMFVNLNVRWIDIDTDAELDGAELETVEIDPLVYTLALGWRF